MTAESPPEDEAARGANALNLYDSLAELPTRQGTPTPPGETPDQRDPFPGRPPWFATLWQQFPAELRGRYEPLAVIGEGGMGIVLEARDRDLGRVVAIKGMRDPSSSSLRNRERQAREHRIAARLTHPNILPVFDVWSDSSGNPWCSMLRVPGPAPTLAARLATLDPDASVEQRPLGQLLEIFLQICRAIAYAHSSGVVHRDLKPANVLFGPSGEAMVCDWGVASAEGLEPASAAELVGTPGYAAPEQLGALGTARSDERSDVYGLGVMLHEMIAGRRPTPTGETAGMTGTPASPWLRPSMALPPRTPRELAAIVRRATAWQPEARFQDAASLLRAVETYTSGGMIEGLEYSAMERGWKWARAHRVVSGAILAAAVFAPVLLATYFRGVDEVRRKLELANQNLAMAHTGWAAEASKSGLPDIALHYAALALAKLRECPPAWTLPGGAAYSLLATPPEASRLLWACTLDYPSEVVEFSPDGKRLHAVTRKIGCFSFDLREGRLAWHRSIPRNQVWGVTISQDGRRVACIGTDRRLHVWETAQGREIASPEGHPEPAWAIALTPGGRLAVTGGFDRAVRLWEVDRGLELARFEGHAGQVWCVAISADGRLAASGDTSNEVRVWDLAARKPLHLLRGHAGPLSALAFSPDGKTLVSGSGNIRLWDVASGRQKTVLGDDRQAVMCLSFSPDGRAIASGHQDNAVRVWDLRTGQVRLELKGHANWPSTVRFSPDGQWLATTSQDRSLRLWDLTDGVGAPRFSGHSGTVVSVGFSKDARQVASAGLDGTARIWDMATGRELRRVPGFSVECQALAFDAAGELRLAGAAGSGIEIRRGPGGRPLKLTGEEARAAGALLFSPDGRQLAATTGGRTVRLFDCTSGRQTSVVATGAADVNGMTFSPDGSRLAFAIDREVMVHKVDSAAQVHRLAGHTEVVMNVAFGPDGKQVASGGLDFDVRLWDLASGTSRVVGAHDGHVWGVAFSQQGDLLASGGLDGKVKLWRLPRGDRLAQLDVEGGSMSLAFSPDGRWLIAGGGGRIFAWDVDVLRDPQPRASEILATSFFTLATEGTTLVPRDAASAVRPKWPQGR